MRFLTLLTAAAALLLFPAAAFAEDSPAAPPGPAAAAPAVPAAPSTPATPAAAPVKTLAKKDDEEGQAGWSLARLGAYLKTKGVLGDQLAAKNQRIADLEARVAALESGAILQALTAENATMRADLEGMAAYAQTHGLLTENPARQPAPTSPAGQIAGQAVSAAVGNQLAALGVPLSQLPAASAPAHLTTLAEIEDELKACKTPAERQTLLAKHRKLILASN